jgi:hypothetical protein
MIWTIISTIITILVIIWLVSLIGIMVVVVPVMIGASLAYVESGGNWIVFIPAAMIVGIFAWIDSKIG